MDIDPACPWCGVEEESEAHVLLSCPVISRIWFAVMGLWVTENAPFHEVVARLLNGVSEAVVGKFITVVYVFWEARNALLFANQELSLGHVFARVVSLEALPQPVVVQRSPGTNSVACRDRWWDG